MVNEPIEHVTLLVDGKVQQPSAFVIPDMSLSSARHRMTKRGFVFSINASRAIANLEPAYASLVADLKKDDEQCGSPQDELAKAGYPSLPQVLANPQILDLVVCHYMLRDILAPLVGDGSGAIQYWFDEVTGCGLKGDALELTGVCYS